MAYTFSTTAKDRLDQVPDGRMLACVAGGQILLMDEGAFTVCRDSQASAAFSSAHPHLGTSTAMPTTRVDDYDYLQSLVGKGGKHQERRDLCYGDQSRSTKGAFERVSILFSTHRHSQRKRWPVCRPVDAHDGGDSPSHSSVMLLSAWVDRN